MDNNRRVLSLDLETYSDVDLGKCGVHRYVEGDFHILLLAYAFDDEDVQIVDMAKGEQIPQEITDAIFDDSIIKAAWNAQFERTCLSKFFGTRLSPDSWQCSMVWAASLSLPLALKNAALILKTGEQKDRAGEDLIRYFSIPCKPTKSNGGRIRNLPEHAPDKWQKFKDYCLQDVRTERDIRKILERFPMQGHEWDYYHMDQRINDRGVLIDRELVTQAITCDLMLSEAMTKRAYELTGLENPNSVSQLKGWLAERGIEADTLGKKNVAAMIKDLDRNSTDQEALEMLRLRLQMAKSSVKKYQAAERYTCMDGRARGLFQFYGANRTGRFCLTGDHEVLTPGGWQRLDEWEGGIIACWNARSEAVSFQHAEKLQFDYEGPMYTYQDARIDQCSTPDHKMRAQRRYGDPWTDMTVEEMAGCRPCIPMNGYRHQRGCANPFWLRVLIMTQADGFYTEDGQVVFNFKKQRKVERCKHLLRKAEIPFVVRNHKGVITILIPARCVPLWLGEFRTKTFGFWLLDENPDIFFDELPHWDGYCPAPNSIQYSTCNKTNADIVQALAHISGRCANVHVRENSKRNPDWKDAYIVDIWLTPKNAHEIRTKPTVAEFRGKVFCAATSTGYFLIRRGGKAWVTGNSGRGIQLQNLPQNHISTLYEARELVRMGCFDMVESIYGNTPDILSQLIRTMLVPKEGYEFIVADFSSIEARVLAWLAGEEWVLDAFRKGEDLYCTVASQMFHVPVVKHGVNGELRQKGKISTLACGYQGSVGALISMGAIEMGLKEDELQEIIDSWREANPNIVRFWWDVEKAAMETIKDHEERTVNRIGFRFYANTLWLVLPSGRQLAYIKPKLQPNRFGRMSITYEGLNAANKWERCETYGGKLVENCVGEGTRVLTDRGLVPIEKVDDEMLIWDGEEWVSHDGLIDRGLKRTVEIMVGGTTGICLTPEHRILTEAGWRRCNEAGGFKWEAVRLPDSFGKSGKRQKWEGPVEMLMLLWGRNNSTGIGIKKTRQRIHFMRMHEGANYFNEKKDTWDVASSSLGRVALHETKMFGSESPCFSQLWRPWNNCMRQMGEKLRKFLERHGLNLEKGTGSGSNRQQQGIQPGKLQMGRKKNQLQEQTVKQNREYYSGENDCFGIIRKDRYRRNNASLPAGPRMADGITVRETGYQKHVYDIRNCGPRHRFAVWDPGTECLRVVSNCTQATARDLLVEAMWRMEQRGLDIVGHVHDEVILEVPRNHISVDEVCGIMGQNPTWADGVALSAAGYKGDWYYKD